MCGRKHLHGTVVFGGIVDRDPHTRNRSRIWLQTPILPVLMCSYYCEASRLVYAPGGLRILCKKRGTQEEDIGADDFPGVSGEG